MPTRQTSQSSIRSDLLLCGAIVLLAFALVYYRSLSFVYVEGDDASIVAYHTLGRDPQLQRLYSPYESMLDALLASLPPREDIVRITAMTLTAVSAPVLFFLMMLLAFDWCGQVGQPSKSSLVAAMLLAIPEFYYLGLVLTPSMIAMALLVGAHLLVRRSTARAGSTGWGSFIISLLLFGIGAAFRWDTVAYGATIAADLFFRAGDRSEHGRPAVRDRLRLSFGWAALAGTTWLVALKFNGWSLPSILHIIRSAGPMESLDWKMGLSRAQTFFTPAFALLSTMGYCTLLRRKHPLAIIVPLAILPVARLVLLGVPKWFITATPVLVACAVAGLGLVWQRPARRYAMLGMLVLPWVIGIRWSYGGIAWGPGFELQAYDRIERNTSIPSPTVGPGMAVPTPEGPRPLCGHAWVLLGEWKRFVNEWSSEQDAAVIHAIEARVPLLLHPDGQAWPVNIYAPHGYSTKDFELRRAIGDNSIFERRWTGPKGDQARMLLLAEPNQLFEAAAVDRLRRIASDTVVISGASSTLIRLQEIAPESLEALGKRTALLHLDRLSAKLPRR